MAERSRFLRFGLVLSSALLWACGRERAADRIPAVIPTKNLEAISLVPPAPPISMGWPQFLFVEGPRSFVWGGKREIYRVEVVEGDPILSGPEWQELTQGLGQLVAGARTPSGTLVVLDTAGRVRGLSPGAGVSWRFATHLRERPGGMAVSERAVYLLLQGEDEERAAVVAYDRAGAEVGRWGKPPAAAVIQARLNGGGIAACPDGSVFYSYINSPDIFKLAAGTSGNVEAIGRGDPTFRVLSDRAVRRTVREGERTRSVAPLVKLGLSASRVMALLCSQEGLLFRQVAQPAGGGSYVEVWSSRTAKLVGMVPSIRGILLGVGDHTLYLGTSPENRFHLGRVRYRLAMPRGRKAR